MHIIKTYMSYIIHLTFKPSFQIYIYKNPLYYYLNYHITLSPTQIANKIIFICYE